MKLPRLHLLNAVSFAIIILMVSIIALYSNRTSSALAPQPITVQKAQNTAAATADSPAAATKPTPAPTSAPASAAATSATESKVQATQSKLSAITAPSQLIDLTNWYVTLPTDKDGNGRADEIHQPLLAGYSAAPYFMLNDAGNGLIFQAHAGGATTSGSHYPRAELREMTSGGKAKAAWSNTSGSHSMTVTAAITHLPTVKPEVVAAQIHDAEDDVIMIRLEGRRLFVESDDGKNRGDLDTAYVLGTTFTVRILAENGHIYVAYNGAAKVDLARSGSGFYFKAGCYTQSNTIKGDSSDAYGQVIMYGLSVTHS